MKTNNSKGKIADTLLLVILFMSLMTFLVTNVFGQRAPENPTGAIAGLDYKYFQGTWSVLPVFSSLTPVKSGIVSTFDITPKNQNDNFGFEFTGFVNIPNDGTYTFYTSSDDGSKLYIGTTQVVSNDGLHGVVEKSGTIGLKAGKHAIRVVFFERTGGESLVVSYAGPGIAKIAIPASALFRIDNIAPSVPTGLVASAITANSFTLNWTASNDNVGVAAYDVLKDGVSIGTTNTTTINVSGLTAGTSYNMSVKAKDAAGNISAASTALNVATLPVGYRYFRLTALGAVGTYDVFIQEIDWMVGTTAYPTAHATGATSTIVATQGDGTSWNAFDGVKTLSSMWQPNVTTYPYSITCDMGAGENILPTEIQISIDWNGRTMSSFSCEGSNDNSTWTTLYTKSGLTQDDWTRDATNSFVFAGGSSDTQAPTSPTNLVSSTITTTSFTLSWTASTDNLAVTGYDVYKDGALYTSVTGTTANISGLTCATTYAMTVKAKDAAGNVSTVSSSSNVSTSVCPDTQAPSIPTSLSSSAISQTSFTLAWSASNDNVGVASYEVFQNGTSVGTTTSTYINVSGLTAGTSYSMTVTAKDGAGNASSASTALNVTTLPAGYRYLRLTALGGVTTYDIYLEEIDWMVGTTAYPTVHATGATSTITATQGDATAWSAFDGVKTLASFWSPNVTTYPFSITCDMGEGVNILPTEIQIAIDWNGRTMSSFSCEGSNDNATWTTLYTKSGLITDDWTRNTTNSFVFDGGTTSDTQAPSTPSTLSSSAILQTSFTLSWTASTDNVGVASYEVFKAGTSIGTTTSTSISVSGLTCNTAYAMTVKAIDAAGNVSTVSTALDVTTSACVVDTQAPSTPTTLTSSSISQTSFTLSWTAATDNVGVTGYDVYKDGVLNTSVTGTTANISGLTCATSYAMTVKAKDAAGNVSTVSSASNVSTSTCSTSAGALYNIDLKSGYPTYSTYVGKGILGSVADNRWNGIGSINTSNIALVNSVGAASGVTFSSNGFGGSFGFRFTYSWGDFSDFWYLNTSNNNATITIQNLTAGENFDLILYAGAGDDNQIMNASVNGGTQIATSGIKTGIIQWMEYPDAKSNCLRFNCTVPSNGIITVNLNCPGSGANIEGMQLQIGTISIPAKGTRTYKLVPDLAAGYDVKVMSIGTSLTDQPYGVSWPSQVYNILYPKYQGHMILSNRAISGSNSRSGVANIENWLALDNPDVVFIEYGMNDAEASSNISIAEVNSNLDFMVSKILANNPHADIIIQTMNNCIGQALIERPNLEQYYQAYRDYANSHGFMLIDNYPLWKNLYDTNPTLWATYVPDGLHPDDNGRANVCINNMVTTLENGVPQQDMAPSVPTGLVSSTLAQTSFTLSWTASTDNTGVTAYEVSKNGTSIGTTTTTSINVSGLICATSYSMTVKAKDAAGNISAASTALSVTTSACSSATLTITARGENGANEGIAKLCDGMITTKWLDFSVTSWVQFEYSTAQTWNTYEIISANDAPARDPKNWTIQGSNDGTTWTTLDTQTGQMWSSRNQTRSYVFNNSTAYKYYRWNITTNNGDALIQVAEFTPGYIAPDTQAPSAPTTLTSSNLTSASFTLSWTASTDNVAVTSYDVYQGTTLKGNTTSTSFDLTGLLATTTYTMTVKAKDAFSNVSDASTALNVTTSVIPATTRTNNVGMNLGNPGQDFNADKAFADAMRASRNCSKIGNWNTDNANKDANYWPTEDCVFLVWAGLATNNNHGKYKLYFKGQATVTTGDGAISNLTYNSANNTTTADILISNVNNEAFTITFASTKRTPASATNTGVTQVKLMRPLSPGSTTSCDTTQLFMNDFIAQLAPFKCLRALGFVATNWNQDSLWSDRTLMQHARQSPPTGGKPYGWEGRGASYEALIMLANQTQKDLWLTIPHKTTDDYVSKLALLFKYGSDGVNPYTSTQANPVYPPLDSNLKLYVEYSNEVWNSQFSQDSWNYAQAALEPIVKYDGSTDNWEWGMRRKGLRTVQISIIFRNVFGSEMMTRVRPVICTQKGYNDRSRQTMEFVDKYFNKRDSRSTWNDPHPVNYYLYGFSGSFYWYTNGSAVTKETIWNSGQWDVNYRASDGFYDQTAWDAGIAKQFGLAYINYEGDVHPTYQNGDEVVINALHSGTWDVRLNQNTLDHLKVLSQVDAELSCFLTLNGGDYSTWAVRNVNNPSNSPQLDAINTFNSSAPIALTLGYVAPFTCAGNAYHNRAAEGSNVNGIGNSTITANAYYWHNSYLFRVNATGAYNVQIQYNTTAPATLVVEYAGNVVGTYNLSSTNGLSATTSFANFNCEYDKVYSIRTVCTSGSVNIEYVKVGAGVKNANVFETKNSVNDFAVTVYPNPASEVFNVSINSSSDTNANINLFDITGKVVLSYSKEVFEGGNVLSLNTDNLQNGLYILRVQSGKTIYNEKVMIRK